MEVVKLFWWQHNCPNGQYPSAKVHRTLKVEPNVPEPKNVSHYDIETVDLDSLKPEVIEGL
jgi:CRISPR-associated protein Csd2